MAHILETGTKDEKILELLREVKVARKALRAICDAAWLSEDILQGAENPNAKFLVIARAALNEMEDAD